MIMPACALYASSKKPYAQSTRNVSIFSLLKLAYYSSGKLLEFFGWKNSNRTGRKGEHIAVLQYFTSCMVFENHVVAADTWAHKWHTAIENQYLQTTSMLRLLSLGVVCAYFKPLSMAAPGIIARTHIKCYTFCSPWAGVIDVHTAEAAQSIGWWIERPGSN